MPRKDPAKAEADRQQAEHTTWRLLVRNPSFLADLRSLRRIYSRPLPKEWEKWSHEKKRRAVLRDQRRLEKATEKWGLSRIPPRALHPFYSLDFPQDLEQIYLSQRDKQGPFPISRRAAELLELKEDKYLYFWVDITKPADQVLAAFEAELREFYQGKKQFPSRRRRQDKINDYLRIYDLHQAGKSFFQIASKLRKPIRTVREDYRTIKSKIVGLGHDSAPEPQKHVINPGPVSRCPNQRCRNAQTKKDFCENHRMYFDEGWGYQREQLYGDPSTPDSAQASTRRKRKKPADED